MVQPKGEATITQGKKKLTVGSSWILRRHRELCLSLSACSPNFPWLSAARFCFSTREEKTRSPAKIYSGVLSANVSPEIASDCGTASSHVFVYNMHSVNIYIYIYIYICVYLYTYSLHWSWIVCLTRQQSVLSDQTLLRLWIRHIQAGR